MKNNDPICGFFGTLLFGAFAISAIGKLISFGSDHPVAVWVLVIVGGVVINVVGAILNDKNNKGGEP